MNNTNFISSAEMISSVFENLEGKLKESSKILKAWNDTVEKISNCGPQLKDHSRVIDLKNGILLIETDHPAWSQMLQLNKKFILIGMNRLSEGVKIDSLAFRVRGSSASLADLPDNNEIVRKEMAKYSKKLAEDEKKLEEKGFVNKTHSSTTFATKNSSGSSNISDNSDAALPDELKSIFDRMKSKVS